MILVIISVVSLSAYLFSSKRTASLSELPVLISNLSYKDILCLFSENYYEARLKFRTKSKAKNLERLQLNLYDDFEPKQNLDLTIDVSIIRRCKTKMLIHVSGTHGVEGFAGSAIQSALLDTYNPCDKESELPTIVFIHALNPFGFANLRRWNENGTQMINHRG